MHMLHLYITYTDNLFCQGHDSAPGLDIMLLKQQHFSVSGQAACQARQHPPVEYVYRRSHPLLQFLHQKLAEWIANIYDAAELNVPPRPDQSRPWSTATLNRILQTCIVSDPRGIHVEGQPCSRDQHLAVGFWTPPASRGRPLSGQA